MEGGVFLLIFSFFFFFISFFLYFLTKSKFKI